MYAFPRTWNTHEDSLRNLLKTPCGFVHDSLMITALLPETELIDQMSAKVSNLEAFYVELTKQTTT